MENIKEQLEEVIKKKHNELFKIDYNMDYNTKLNLQRKILEDFTDEVLKVVVENERKWIEDNWINFYESSKPLADFKKELLRKLNLLSPNKENKNNG